MGLKLASVFITIVLLFGHFDSSAQIYLTREGNATFISDAPLEEISASSNTLSGAINITDDSFAFRIDNKSFIGFNSLLQQEHFYENYIEVDKYNYSTFQGKIIEKLDLEKTGPQEVRAKGVLSIHGNDQERIIRATITVAENKLIVQSEFTLALEDHDIRIPKIVYQKIAEIILVEINAELNLKTD